MWLAELAQALQLRPPASVLVRQRNDYVHFLAEGVLAYFSVVELNHMALRMWRPLSYYAAVKRFFIRAFVAER